MAFRNRLVLNRFNNWRLKLAEPFKDHPGQFKRPPKPKEPVVKTIDRKLPTLAQSAMPYEKYQDLTNKRYGTFWDPLFNPNLNDERYRVDPNQEPFCAIYADSKSDSANEYTMCRNIATPELWSYVDRLARIKIAPEPERRKAGELLELPSGFVPPPENPPDLPYFVPRTRNYLLPVYYQINSDVEKCYTIVKLVTGDLWQLEQDLREHLEGLQEPKRKILTSVQETDGRIFFKGKHIHATVDWLIKQGF